MQSANAKETDAKVVLHHLVKKIPQELRGLDKVIYIDSEIISNLSLKAREMLREFVTRIFREAQRYQASDIEFGSVGARDEIWFRIQGKKRPIEELGKYSRDELNVLILNLLAEPQRFHLIKKRSIDFSFEVRGEVPEHEDIAPDVFRYRTNVYLELGDLSLSMRTINTAIRPYNSYQFDPRLSELLSLRHTKAGVVLVTGITGAGKSTTLDAIIDMNNRTVPAHISIIASPIEFIHESKKCIVRHREVGVDTISFKDGTVEALRQDPDIIVIGEMRDPETIMAALEAADTGHKIFSTLHTSSAIESLDRIIGEVSILEKERVRMRLADTLSAVISQKLVPSMDGKLVLAKEVLINTPAVRSAIKGNNIPEIYQLISEGKKVGMHTFEQDLKRLFKERKISRDTAVNYANNKARIRDLLNINPLRQTV